MNETANWTNGIVA